VDECPSAHLAPLQTCPPTNLLSYKPTTLNVQTSIHVEILDRSYTLRVEEGNAERTRTVAEKVDDRMRAFQREHPEQAKLTTAIITSLALAEDLHDEREARADDADALSDDLQALTSTLEGALAGERARGDGDPASGALRSSGSGRGGEETPPDGPSPA